MSNGHRKMTREAARDLIALFILLVIIIVAALNFRKHLDDPKDAATKDWYYQNVAPPGPTQPRTR